MEASGFKKSEASSLRIDVETTLRQDFQLTVGGATEMVTVTAESQMVQTDNVSSGTVVRGTLVDALPISGRDFTNLLRLSVGQTCATDPLTLLLKAAVPLLAGNFNA